MDKRVLAFWSVAGGLILAASGACGGKESTASRSAAAYDEAQRKGAAPGAGAGHGGHAAEKPQPAGVEPTPATAAGHGGHEAAQRESPSMAGMDHSKMTGTKPGAAGEHAGHDMTPGAKAPMAGMDHSQMPGMSMPPPRPEPKAAAAAPGQPAATLQRDAFDAPAETAVDEAKRAAALAAEMAAGGHGMHHGTYRQLDAGREGAAPPGTDAHRGHEKPKPKPSPIAR